MGRCAALIALTPVLFGCGQQQPPKRPAGVSADAVWAGGLDGGSFIMCEIDSRLNVNKCVVYNDFTGQVMEKGDFRLKNEGRAARPEELKYTWADWGGMIGLANGKVLSRVYLTTKQERPIKPYASRPPRERLRSNAPPAGGSESRRHRLP